ncbi:hypothetical protein ACJMK2_034191 [Sinanodonta woodiana]|uniref:Peroxiredoxin-like 2A n=1 Tax=Sinanodonta woodiana TaxID=1069815 RepID=A0ABD3WQT4_SINWO
MFRFSRLFTGAVGVAAGAVLLCNLSLFDAKPQLATLDYLANAKLQTIDSSRKNFTEAQDLSLLKDEMDAHGVRLLAVVHETLGVSDFKSFFKGDVFLDLDKIFYGPVKRWASLFDLLRFGVLKNGYRVFQKQIPVDLVGEGRLLGGLFVIGPGNQGIIFQYHEKEFGDHASLQDVQDAIRNIKKIK